MNCAGRYRLAPGVTIRFESFGGLIYRHDNRRLYFLRSHEIAEFISGLDGLRPLDQAIAEFVASRGLAKALTSSLVAGVAQMEKMGIVTLSAGDGAREVSDRP